MSTLSRQLRALSLLLDYPREDVHAHLDELGAVLAPLDAGERACESLADCLAAMAAADPMELQADFVDTFDRGRSTSLNLFEQVHGDSRDRGQAMVDLLEQYRRTGLVLQARQLPDYLPVYLEYCSVLDTSAAREALEEVALLVAHLAAALERRESRWLAVVAAVCRLAGVDEWKALLAAEADSIAAASPRQRDGDAAVAADWTPAGLDAAWAEAPVEFLGACNPQSSRPSVQTVKFVGRNAGAPGRS